LPGVEAATFADFIPSGGGRRFTTIAVENYTPRSNENMDVLNGVIASEYFKTMEMKLLAGREFTEHDNAGAPRTVIINDALARRYWPGRNALGKHIAIAGGRNAQQLEVIGVVQDATAYIFQESAAPFFYLPLLQNPSPGMTLHVRSKGDPLALMPALRNEFDALGQSVTLHDAGTLSDHVSDALLMLRVVSTLTGVFGLLAFALALVGVFSVVNYSASRRTREIGIRLALGAQRADILRMILKDALVIVLAGVAAGLFMAIASGRLLASFMFANTNADSSVYIVAALLLIAIAMLACFIPAYKATRVDPTDALRHE
jgi:predicted permease